MKIRWFLPYVYVISLISYLLLGLAYTFYKENFGEQEIHVKEFPRIASLNQLGQYKTISDFSEKTILVNFWFASCPECLESMKYFPQLLERFPELIIMSFSIDEPVQMFELVKSKAKPWTFLVEDNPRWTFYHADQNEKNGYIDLLQVTSFPTYFIVDKRGNIISSPYNAIFGVEKEMAGISSFKISVAKYFESNGFRKLLKGLAFYHVIFFMAFLLIRYFQNRAII